MIMLIIKYIREIIIFALIIALLAFAYYHFHNPLIETKVITDTVEHVIKQPKEITKTLIQWKEFSPSQSTKEVVTALKENKPATIKQELNADKIIKIQPQPTKENPIPPVTNVYVNLDRVNSLTIGAGINSSWLVEYHRDMFKLGKVIIAPGVAIMGVNGNTGVLVTGTIKW